MSESNHQSSYSRVALALMPQYPAISREIKTEIAEKAAKFIKEQFSQQPLPLFIALKFLVVALDISIKLAGVSAFNFWRMIPMGGVIERLFRSLVVLVFFENTDVLDALGEESGAAKLKRYRTIRNENI